MRSVPRIEEGAGTLEHFVFEHVLVAAGEVHGLRYAVRPLDPYDIRLEMRAEPE